MYVCLFLQKERVNVDEYDILGITALQLAMKIEEIDIVSFNHRVAYSEKFTIPEYETRIMNNLGMKLLPDTLYNWLEVYIEYWDQFILNSEPRPLRVFFKQKLVSIEGRNR